MTEKEKEQLLVQETRQQQNLKLITIAATTVVTPGAKSAGVSKTKTEVEFLSEELLSFLHFSSGLKGLTFTMVSFTLLSTIVSRGKERVELTKARH